MATGALAPSFWFTCLDDDGVPFDGHLYFYLTGTQTPATVYQDADLQTAWAFPAVASSSGRIVVYLDPAVGNLKLIVKTSAGVQVGPTVDPVAPTNAGVSGLGEVFVFCSNSASLVTDTSYVSGATLDKIQPGSVPWRVDPSVLSGTYVLEAVGVQNTAGTLTVAVVNLTDGAPDTPIATATFTSATGAIAQSGAITFPMGGSDKDFAIKAKVSANSGYVIGARIVRTA